jgi:transcriptional regulator with XRE-family HTH domain
MDQGRAWAARMAAAIGERVAHYRDQAHISAQELADRCEALGMPSISRIVVTKLENGRREAVSTAELQVLGKALDVPPILLLFPLGYTPTVEALPGREGDPWAAIEWFTGNSGDPADPAAAPQMGEDSPLVLWEEQRRYEDAIAQMDAYRATSIDPAHRPSGARAPLVPSDIFAENIEALTTSLRRVRQTMRGLGLTPPPLRPETVRIIGEEATDGEH